MPANDKSGIDAQSWGRRLCVGVVLAVGMWSPFGQMSEAAGGAGTAGATKAVAPVTGDAAIVAARAAYQARNLAALNAVDASGHVLAVYVDYWRLQLSLQALPPQTPPTAAQEEVVHAFLQQWADTPLAQPLQSAWLKALGKSQDWVRFAADYPPVEEDTELQCYGVRYRFQRDGAAALDAGKALWLTGKTLPEACNGLFDTMFAKGALTTEDVWARYTLAVEAMNAPLIKAMWKALPAAQQADERSFAKAERQSLKYLEEVPTPKQKGAAALVRYALERAARQDVNQARRAWLAVREHWPKADQEYGNARLAFYAARTLHPDAHRYFGEIGRTPLNPTQQAWQIRAALRSGDNKAALAAIEALPASERDIETWRYWKARCLEASAVPEAQQRAQTMYTQLAAAPTYYGFLASERLGVTSALPVRQAVLSEAVSAAAVQNFLAQNAARRLLKLNALDMRPEMLREWARLIKPMNDAELLVAAQAMQQQGLYDRAIAAADRTIALHDFNLRYPRPFEAAFTKAAEDESVDAAWLFAVARQESRFIPDIVSSAGAIGLMQLMPKTAHWVAKKTEAENYKTAQLNDAAVNTRFGAFYLKHCLDQLDGSLALAAAAYNAGPGRARAWRAKAPVDGDLWVDTIPFDETRDYVRKVLSNAKVYALQRGETFSVMKTLAIVSTPPSPADMAAIDPTIDGASGDGAVGEDGKPTAAAANAAPGANRR